MPQRHSPGHEAWELGLDRMDDKLLAGAMVSRVLTATRRRSRPWRHGPGQTRTSMRSRPDHRSFSPV